MPSATYINFLMKNFFEKTRLLPDDNVLRPVFARLTARQSALRSVFSRD